MQARSAKQVIADMQSIADAALSRHEILEDVEINENEGYWVIGRPGSSAYRVQISVLKFGVLHVHGDSGPAMWGTFYDDDMSRLNVLRWMAKRPTWDGYLAEKAVIAMGGRPQAYDRAEDVALWEAQQQLEQVLSGIADEHQDATEMHPSDLTASQKREVKLWRAVCAMIESRDHSLPEIDKHIYDSTHDPEMCGIGEVLSSRVIWSHFLVRKLWALLQDKGIVK